MEFTGEFVGFNHETWRFSGISCWFNGGFCETSWGYNGIITAWNHEHMKGYSNQQIME
jgi:hypothetical protein